VEDLEEYRVGGFHPVHLGDSLDGGRYQILHKLGYGGFSTVWLGRDQQLNSYVALKILMAECSSEDCSEVEILKHIHGSTSDHPGRQFVASLPTQFRFDGPNGSHLCLVSPVLGPSISILSREGQHGWFAGSVARKLALQASQGLAYLHSCGVVHGGFYSLSPFAGTIVC
jgi:serine/threonine-protein kinase SRPK3